MKNHIQHEDETYSTKKVNLSFDWFTFIIEERKTRLELATPTLARLCSTN